MFRANSVFVLQANFCILAVRVLVRWILETSEVSLLNFPLIMCYDSHTKEYM